MATRTTPEALLAGLRRFYYDLAGPSLSRTLPALRILTDPGHLLYGSDYCFAPKALVQALAEQPAHALTAPGEWQAVMADNARPLFPRLAALGR